MESVNIVQLNTYTNGKNAKEAKETKKQVDSLLRLAFPKRFDPKLYFMDMSDINSIFFTTLSKRVHNNCVIYYGEIREEYVNKLNAYQLALLCYGYDSWCKGEVAIKGDTFSVTIYIE